MSNHEVRLEVLEAREAGLECAKSCGHDSEMRPPPGMRRVRCPHWRYFEMAHEESDDQLEVEIVSNFAMAFNMACNVARMGKAMTAHLN
jgi:hypothetical protein